MNWKLIARKIVNPLLKVPGLHSLARLAARQGFVRERVWAGVPIEGIVTLHAAGQVFRYDLSPGDYVGMPLYWLGDAGYEPETLVHLAGMLEGTKIFFDIGANTGLFSILAALINPELQVVAIEPNPETAIRLRRNIALNALEGRVTVIEAAVATTSGTITLHVPNGVFALSSTLAPEGHEGSLPGHREVSVRAISLGAMVEAHGIPGAIKIDAEGYEAAILEDSASVLAAYRPKILIEVLDDAPFERLASALTPHGYRFARLGQGEPKFQNAIGPRLSSEGRNVMAMV